MLHISTFSGIGGFDLAAEWMGWQNIASCEINPFCNRILSHHWPDAYHHTDIHTLTYKLLNEELTKRHGAKWRSDDIILTGGFPCQPYSQAGKRLGKEDERHLWPEMLRVIREIRPEYVMGENVAGLLNWSGGLVFEEVQVDLENEGYEVQAFVLPACSVNAPHRRDRVWFIARLTNAANSKSIKNKWVGQTRLYAESSSISIERTTSNANKSGCERDRTLSISERKITSCAEYRRNVRESTWQNFPTQPPICTGNDGVPAGLDGITFPKWRNESIKAAGNAVVPPLVYELFKAIEYARTHKNH